jgi:hypothetical protein
MFWRNPIVNKSLCLVWYETDDIKICIGEISADHNKWNFHHNNISANLKPNKLQELRSWAKDQIILMNLTERKLK